MTCEMSQKMVSKKMALPVMRTDDGHEVTQAASADFRSQNLRSRKGCLDQKPLPNNPIWHMRTIYNFRYTVRVPLGCPKSHL
jgi:hypothetical protein